MQPFAKVLSLVIVPNMTRTTLGGFDVFWDVQTYGFTPTFMPQYSFNDVDNWQDLISAPVTSYSISSVGPKNLSFQQIVFFRLQVLNGSTIVTTTPGTWATFIQNKHDRLLYREMVRREHLGLNRYNGEPGLLFRRITYGTPCSQCIDETLNDPASNECPSCYGTGFEGGYYPAYSIKTDWDDSASNPINASLSATGPSETDTSTALFPPYPSVKFKDIYVELPARHRFEIQSVETDEFRGSTVRQIVKLSQLPASDPAYQIPIE